jgi:hypothetical protein
MQAPRRYVLLASWMLVAFPGTVRAADPPPPVVSAASANAAYAAKLWAACAARFQALAEQTSGAHARDALYNAACCHARDGNRDRAFAMLDAAIAAGLRDVDGLVSDTDLASLHAEPRWAATVRQLRARVDAWEKSLKAPDLRRRLLEMAEEDQRVRSAWLAAKREDPAWQALASKVAAVDAKNSGALRAAIAKWDWPANDVVGEDGAHAAWLLAQHADRDLPLQKQVLAKMEPLVQRGLVSASDYAYLYDRVAVAEHHRQRYGTQFDGTEPLPIEDPDHVDARRRAVGLSTLSDYRKQIVDMYGPH